uniref:Uncharacterized protein n=1 Tax=Avena sativa TaxID=4498 RepID=A0ACD5ZEE1_AVESA
MDFSGAVEWWDEWQLRLLVLGSLLVQYILFFSSMARRCALRPMLRLFIWLAYLGGDALAIYALATLFNRHRQGQGQGQQHDGSGLEVLWAPILLIHLGGQHVMIAYSIQDNELWMRHTITVMSQVMVALYIFCRSWSGEEKRLLQAAILLFVVGIIRYTQRPWGMMAATVSSIIPSFFLPTRPRKQGLFTLWCQKLLFGCSSDADPQSEIQLREEQDAEEKDTMTLEEFLHEARESSSQELASDEQQEERIEQYSGMELPNIFMLLVDISAPYCRRIKSLQLQMALDYRHADSLSRDMLRKSFLLLYTKMPAIITIGPGCCLHLSLPFLTLVSLILFSTNHTNHSFDVTDVKVTYILLSCTAVLDFIMVLTSPCIVLKGPEKVSQHNLLSHSARNNKPTVMMKLATLVCCRDYVNMHCYTRFVPKSSSSQVGELVHGYVRDGWKNYIRDAASYKRFNSRRGQWALRHQRHLRWSLEMPFDRSVLLWHIATDLCFHHQSTSPRGQACAAQSRVISNYMAYLLSLRPEMLMPGSRNTIFALACDDIESMLGLPDEALPPLDERGLAQGILARAQQSFLLEGASMIGPIVPNACKLANALMELRDEGHRWKVVQGVWVEMLCYSAGWCRGYTHAKYLSEVEELLSRVWALLAFMGMETFADRFQKLEPEETKEDYEDEKEGGDDGEGKAVESKIDIPA